MRWELENFENVRWNGWTNGGKAFVIVGSKVDEIVNSNLKTLSLFSLRCKIKWS
jgi:hypothetical protein